MASAVQMRDAIIVAYPSKRWAEKVKRMPDNQVIAVYMRLKLQGKV
jgi:NAD(P)H-dependent flavin oxidoreductase YrpB (nitropropane dioxygenase family)